MAGLTVYSQSCVVVFFYLLEYLASVDEVLGGLKVKQRSMASMAFLISGQGVARALSSGPR